MPPKKRKVDNDDVKIKSKRKKSTLDYNDDDNNNDNDKKHNEEVNNLNINFIPQKIGLDKSVIVFHDKSKSKANVNNKNGNVNIGKALFKEKGEQLGKDDNINFYKRLEALDKDWRKVLSSSYAPQTPIDFEGMRYATQEHALQAQKFCHDDDFKKKFSLDCEDSDFNQAHQLEKAIAAGKKNGKYTSKDPTIPSWQRDPDIVPVFTKLLDDGYNETVEQIMLAKYTGDKHSRDVLMATVHAMLYDKGSSKSSNINGLKRGMQEELMCVRMMLRKV